MVSKSFWACSNSMILMHVYLYLENFNDIIWQPKLTKAQVAGHQANQYRVHRVSFVFCDRVHNKVILWSVVASLQAKEGGFSKDGSMTEVDDIIYGTWLLKVYIKLNIDNRISISIRIGYNNNILTVKFRATCNEITFEILRILLQLV